MSKKTNPTMMFSFEKKISEHWSSSHDIETHIFKKHDPSKHGPARAFALRELEWCNNMCMFMNACAPMVKGLQKCTLA